MIVNPISGQKKAVKYYETVLKPMLDTADIKHDVYYTESAEYVGNFIKDLNLDEKPYTEFVLISGDGIFNQVVNA